MARSSRTILKWTAGFLLIMLAVVSLVLGRAHRDIAEERSPLPPPAKIVKTLKAQEAEGPRQLYWINTASQTVPTSGVMDTLETDDVDSDFVMSFPSFILEWADGRLLLVDVGMDESGAVEFGAPLEMLGMAEPMKPLVSVNDKLGQAREKVQGITFTHLHADHVGGIKALCQSGDFAASVFMTEAQAERPNFTTSGGLDLLRETDCIRLRTSRKGPVYSLEGFPGVGLIRAAGHTPGSQLVVARIGSGPTAQNVVFTGDIVNHAEAIPLDRGKPLLYRTFIVPEDETRQASLRKFLAELEQEHAFTPLVSHDQTRLETSPFKAWPGVTGSP